VDRIKNRHFSNRIIT